MPFSHNPPLLSANTVIATAVRTGRVFGKGLSVLRWFLGHAQSDQVKAKVFASYQPTARDVFIATFPKSGTNWAMQMVAQVAWHGQAEFGHIHDLVPWPEARFHGLLALDDPSSWEPCPTGKRGIKTALGSHHVPYDEAATYVTVVRDPKEVVVSSYHFICGVFGLGKEITVDQWCADFLGGSFIAGSWAEHTAGYWAWRNRPNVEVMCFPRMKDDLPGTVDRVARVMGVSFTRTQRSRVIERCSFAHMKANESKFAPPQMRFVDGTAAMIRKGESGASGELLSRAQQAAIDRHCQAELLRLGADFPYADVFDVVEG
ncbi:MAG: sulfotransferase domain-containing protein [Deltaproteobacteria bacterium]|nr:sulfotransferase domain-containing protein [Deltaproteobacteria bacterium]